MDTFRIFLSSPGDVAEERLIARRVIDRLRVEFSGRIQIEPVFWEHEPLVASASFQDQLPHPADSDAAICVLWARLGTRLPASFRKPDGSAYASGTEFEFEDALSGLRRRGKPALLVYRKTAPPFLEADVSQLLERVHQKQALDAFVRRWFHDETDGTLRAAFHPFADVAQFEEIIEIHLRKLIARAYPEAVGAQRNETVTWRHESPFRGLEAFGFQHAPIFFGRTAAIGQMMTALRQQQAANRPFLLVIGASGSGKSSVVRSGVLPILTQPGVIEGVQKWRRAEFRPRDRRTSLSSLLVDALTSTDDVGDLTGPTALLRQLESQSAASVRIALVIDQLEEVFSQEGIDFSEREEFFSLLAQVTATGAVWTIATLRSDVYPRCIEHEGFVTLKAGNGQYDLSPPTPAEIGQIIRLPALAAGLRFETHLDGGQGLDELLRDETMRSPEALPLLEFALEELYKRRSSDGTLTFAAYAEIGGVEGALAQRAEAVFSSLPAQTQINLPQVLRRLISASASEAGVFSRRSTPTEEFAVGPERDLVHALIEARLCISELGGDGRPVVSIAHEALLRHWPRVNEWLDTNRDILRAHGRLAVSSERWNLEGRRPDLLLAAGRPLEEALAVIESGADATTTERALIAASVAKARRARLVRACAVAGLAVLTIISSVAALIANSQRERARTEASTTQETMNFMVSLFTLADPGEARANEFTVRDMLDRGAEDVKRQLGDRPAVRSGLMTAMGRAYIGLGLPAPAKDLLGEALRIRSQPNSNTTHAAVETKSALAAATFLAGEYEEAENLYRETLASARAIGSEGDFLVASNLSGLADTLTELGSDEEAEKLYREALSINRRTAGAQSVEVAQTLQGLARNLFFSGRYDESESLMLEGLAIRREKLGSTHWKVADSLSELGSLHYQTGLYEQAVSEWKESLAISEYTAGKDHPDVGTVSNNIGRGLLIDGKLDEARPYLERALELWRRAWPKDHDDLAIPLNSLAMIDLANRDYADAEASLTEALRICEVRKFWLLDQVLTNLADLYAHTGRATQAPALLDRARTLLEEQYPLADMPDEAWRYALQDSVRASVYTAEKNYPDAEKLLVVSLPVIEARFGAQRYYTTTTRQRLATLYKAWGKPALAARYAR